MNSYQFLHRLLFAWTNPTNCKGGPDRNKIYKRPGAPDKGLVEVARWENKALPLMQGEIIFWQPAFWFIDATIMWFNSVKCLDLKAETVHLTGGSLACFFVIKKYLDITLTHTKPPAMTWRKGNLAICWTTIKRIGSVKLIYDDLVLRVITSYYIQMQHIVVR